MIIVNKKRITKQHTKRSSYPITHAHRDTYIVHIFIGGKGYIYMAGSNKSCC